jgi:hypothetical protein
MDPHPYRYTKETRPSPRVPSPSQAPIQRSIPNGFDFKEENMKQPIYMMLLTVLLVGAVACSNSQKRNSASNAPEEFNPKLTRPEVRKVWVPDRISGEEYESGHWKFLIQKNSSWAKED